MTGGHVARMLRAAIAARAGGEPAQKIDLGEEWKALTALPFVWAFWAGRRDALSGEALNALIAARDQGVAASDAVAAAYCGSDRAERGRAYLRENIQYTLGSREQAGLMKYYELARDHGVVNSIVPPLFYR